MTAKFNPKEFVDKLEQGEFDGRLVDILRSLSDDELEEVVGLIMDAKIANSLAHQVQ
jgi:hypothetical protein